MTEEQQKIYEIKRAEVLLEKNGVLAPTQKTKIKDEVDKIKKESNKSNKK